MANTIDVKLKMSDDGSLRLTEKSAKKLGMSLDQAGISAQTADRQLKGAARTSANSTKNFSKMAQGISGGLVPAYATLAAQVFAVSAAFQFLTDSANFANLIQGQQEFGAITGTAFKTITSSLQDATQGQLQYAEAARATAIGTAAGLNAAQLEGLSTAATNASLALGRDLTDSFNRLIRGVTKAEPELLDELGIILKLDPALRNYAAALDKNVSELTAFERTQAVTNDVLDQAEQKYARIAEVIDPAAFAVAQFRRAFDDLLNTLRLTLNDIAQVVLPFFTNNINALVAALGLFALPIIKSIIPSFKDMAANARESVNVQKEKLGELRKEYDKSKAAALALADTQEKALNRTAASASKILAEGGVDTSGQGTRSGTSFLTGEADNKSARNNAKRIIEAAEKQAVEGKKVTTGVLKGLNAQQVADLRQSYLDRIQAQDDFQKKSSGMFTRGFAQTKRGMRGLQVAWGETMAFMTEKVGKFVGFIGKVGTAISVFGIVVLVFELAKELLGFNKASSEAEERLRGLTDRFGDATKAATLLREELARSAEVRVIGDDVVQNVMSLGQAISAVKIKEIAQDFNDLAFNANTAFGKTDEYATSKAEIQALGKEVAALSPEFAVLGQEITKDTKITEDQVKAMLKAQSILVERGIATSQLSVAQRDLNQAMNKFMKTTGKELPFTKEIKLSEVVVDGLQKKLEGVNIELQKKAANKFQAEMQRVGQAVAILENAFAIAPSAALADQIKKAKEELQDLGDQYLAVLDENKKIVSQLQFQKNFTKELKDAQTTVLKLRKDQTTTEKNIADLQLLGNTFAEQRAKTEIDTEKAKLANLKAREALEAAMAADRALEADTDQTIVDAVKEQVRQTQAKVDLTEKAIELAGQEALKKTQNINLEERLLNFQKTINSEKLIQLDIERQIALLKGGLGPQAGRGTAAEAAEERRLTLERLRRQEKIDQQEVKKARGRVREATGVVDTGQGLVDIIQPGFSEKDVEDRQDALKTAESVVKTTQTNIQLNTQLERSLLNQEKTKTRDLELRNQAFSFDQKEEAFRTRINELRNEGALISELDLDAIRVQTDAQVELNNKMERMTQLRDTIASSMTDAFTSLIDGSKSAKQAFGDMAKSIIKMIIEMTIRMIIANTIMKSIGSFMGFGGGGIAQPSSGATTSGVPANYSPRYNTGGISKGPESGYLVELHGVEAIVPLPDGKNIPAQLSGKIQTPAPIIDIQTDTNAITNSFNAALSTFKAESPMAVRPTVVPTPSAANGNGTNNVTVNVSMETGEATTTERKGPNMSELGKTVAAAVQAELQHQKRPGGILSPFGAS